MLKKAITVLVFFLLLIFTGNVFAQEKEQKAEALEAKVEAIIEEKEVDFSGFVENGQDTEEGQEKQLYQKLGLLVTKGFLKGETIIVESGNLPMANLPKYKVGDNVLVEFTKDFEGNDLYYISDFVRRDSLLLLFIIFTSLVLLVGQIWGATSILSMVFSFLVIFEFILPQILKGANPVLAAIVGSLVIIPFTFFLSHGLNKKTSIAILGTIISIIITGILAGIFVETAKLTGFASEEAAFLQVARAGQVNIRGLLLAGIIIGTLGVLDDVTISQSAIVVRLKSVNKKLTFQKLYSQAMKVGRDHISSMVNTLVLVYSGAALPLLLLFADSSRSFSEVINYEIIAEEIIRTLVGSIGLILAVPITTVIASFAFERDNGTVKRS